MQIVIDIHEKDYQAIKNGHIPFGALDAIMNGTPLPKGHGRLIDADYKVSSDGRTVNSVCGYIAPTIIEAEPAESDPQESDYKLTGPKLCPFCGSKARIRDLFDVVDWTDDDEPITKRRFVCECSKNECLVNPVTDVFDTEVGATKAWNRRYEGE